MAGKKPFLLIVDDDLSHRTMLRTMLNEWNYATEEVGDGDVAVEAVRNKAYDAILMDLRMIKMGGMEALKEITVINPSIPVLIMTAYYSVGTAVEALRNGAADYLIKPLDFDLLQHTLERTLEHTRLSLENKNLKDQIDSGITQSTILLGKSQAMQDLVALVNTVGASEATVLITGESGTGKELVAKALHQASPRADMPLVTVNCAALTDSLLESELFGYEKGAFTGADKRREGRFAQADGGILFLDEIGELPLLLQAKLLRAIQEGEIQRLGSDTPFKVDVRLLTATNRNLQEEVKAGRFREDLFYRLNVITIQTPALRERVDDIPVLAAIFLERFKEKNRKTIKGFTPQAMDALCKYTWPGNVRELENALERAVILATGDFISPKELPFAVTLPDQEERALTTVNNMFTTCSLESLEKQAIMAVLKETNDNKSETARRLGITRVTLNNKLKKYSLE